MVSAASTVPIPDSNAHADAARRAVDQSAAGACALEIGVEVMEKGHEALLKLLNARRRQAGADDDPPPSQKRGAAWRLHQSAHSAVRRLQHNAPPRARLRHGALLLALVRSRTVSTLSRECGGRLR